MAAQPPGEGDSFPFEPLLADFGLASRLDRDADETCYGTVLGTIHYMSPEQAAGHWKDVGVPSDVYSLGVILYELLTGDRPIPGNDDSMGGLDQGGSGTDRAPPRSGGRRWSLRSKTRYGTFARQLRKHVPADLNTICLKCLANEPAERYTTAGELAADLRCFLGHKPIHAHPPGLFKQVRLWCRRRPVIAALLLLLALTLVTSAAVTGALYNRERMERARAEEHLNFAREAVSKMYTKVADQWLVEQPEVQGLRREFLEDALRFYERIVAQRPQDEKSQHDLSVALHRMANIAANLRRSDEAIQFRQRCLEIIDTLRSESPANAAYQYDAFMNRLLLVGEMPLSNQQRIVILLEAEAIIRELVNAAPSNAVYRDALAALCCSLARNYQYGGQSATAERLWKEAAVVSEALLREYPDRLPYAKHAATAYGELALQGFASGQRGAAGAFFLKAKRLIDDVRRKAPDARWADEWSFEVQIDYAHACAKTGDSMIAVPILEDCRDALNRLIAWYPDTPAHRANRAQVCVQLADAYAQLDQTADSLAALEMAESDARTVPDETTATKLLHQIDHLKKHLPATDTSPQP